MIGHDPHHTYRAVVIGAGSGGLTAAIGLAGFGHEVVLVEGGAVGGDCTNTGCIPSKTLLHAAATGIADPLAHTRRRRDELAAEEDEMIREHESIRLVRGWASLTGRRDGRAHVVRVAAEAGEVEIRAQHVVIAGGSTAATIDISGLDASMVVTTEHLFELPEAPRHLLVVGGGAIAVEMATAFAAIGTQVDLVELLPRVLAAEDPVVTDIVEASLRSQGVGLHLGTTVERIDGSTVHLADGTTIDGVDRVLMAVGRRPRLVGLGLDDAGVEYTPTGIVADDWGRTSVAGIWAVGDVTGNTMTTHGAGAVARRTVRAIALPKLPKRRSLGVIPSAVYGVPEVASVGISAAAVERVESRHRLVVPYQDIDRGFTDGIVHGVLVVDVERFTGRILRAAVAGPGAADMIGIFTIAIDHGVGLRSMFSMVHPYPSHAEVIRQAADDFARLTYSSLPAEWTAMTRGRLRRLTRRR